MRMARACVRGRVTACGCNVRDLDQTWTMSCALAVAARALPSPFFMAPSRSERSLTN